MKKHGGPLQPKSPRDEAKTLQWTLWGATEIERPLIDVVSHRHALPPEKRDESIAKEA